MLLLNQMLLSCTCNITRTMRSVKQNIRPSYLDSANNECLYYLKVSLVDLESKMLVNKLNKKEMETFSQKQISKSNKPQRESRSCVT